MSRLRKVASIYPISLFFSSIHPHHHHSNNLSTASDIYLNLFLQKSPSQTLPPLGKSLSQIKYMIDSSVNSVIRNSLALRFFVWVGLQSNYRHSALMYSRACEFLEIEGCPKTLTNLLEAHRIVGTSVSIKIFKAILSLCQEAKLADEVLGVLKRMGEF